MPRPEVVVEVLDTLSAVLVLPGVAGSQRLGRVRTFLATDAHRPVNQLLQLARYLAGVAGVLLFMWFLSGVFVVGQIVDDILFEIFDADSLGGRAAVIGGSIALLSAPALVAGVIALAALVLRAILWLPAKIAAAHPLSGILVGAGFVVFLTSRAIAIAIEV